MVAFLMTFAFLGYEWVVSTSAPRIAVYRAEHAKIA
jgi:hypothetical protein